MIRRRQLILTAFITSVMLSLIVIEIGLRVFASVKDEWLQFDGVNAITDLEDQLDPYELVSSDRYYHWTLRPRYNATKENIVADKIAAGKSLGAAANSVEKGQYSTSGIRINSDGFRGNEIITDSDVPKILMLGDSVTFGLTTTTYPNVVNEKFAEKNIPVQVINAGVEGYSIRNLEFELERYLALKPQIVTIMIGWNDIYTSTPTVISIFDNLALVRAVKRIAWHIETNLLSKDQLLTKMYGDRESTEIGASEVDQLKEYSPPYVERLEMLVKNFKKTGANVYLMTLPGVFTMSSEPSDRALKIGHLPTYTRNPYVLAALSEANNKALKNLAKRQEVEVLDVASWSEEHLSPRDQYFSDAVHLTVEGLTKLAGYVVEELSADFPYPNNEHKN